MTANEALSPTRATLSDLTQVFGRIGILSFGGPAAQIGLMHRELVDERSWLSEEEYLNALSFCMLLPGPEAMQLATYAGWKLRGVPGGLIAGLLFVLPGAAIVLALALGYAYLGALPAVDALMLGVKATVVVIVIEALLKVAKRALGDRVGWVIAGLAFAAIFALNLPFPLIIAAAAAWGAIRANSEPGLAPPPAAQARLSDTVRTIGIWLVIWLGPLLALWLGGATFLTDLGLFFSKLAVVTFGGAYAVLAYMTQEVVNTFGWLTTEEMMAGLGLAETTPGPLILVTEFVGLLAGFKEAGLGLAVAAAIVTLWMTFAPCFLWIFAGAPYIEWIASRPRLTGALRAITAAVVGVILNLSIWFGLHVFFTDVSTVSAGPLTLALPDPGTLDWRAVLLAIGAGILLLRFKYSVITVLAVAATAGLVLGLAFPA
ncbi:MAG: chromate efflux transporter [Pseudomonadota bacterium]